ncbi:forkhead box protein H1-like [Dunckerocampus dactyliophorus]|uniref:forkhead box protein H1-like n=1 Tax=Dunckerocampus dactyliophorus TaxID=161453 RepID=UPI002406E1E8|nr:forkhead box protein H1-like [Dunckerocampus dactyliophorus]
MQTTNDKVRALLPPAGDVFRRSTTYLARIAVVLQDAPDKMLTFAQLMDRLGPLIREDRKSIKNNIRVCLSTSKCFVKIPLFRNSVGSKRNFWKLDLSQLTSKMVRRHFKDVLDFFPELTSRGEDAENAGVLPTSPEASSCDSVQIRCEVKFSGPFSIESLLKRDSPASRDPSRCSMPILAEQHQHQHHSALLPQKRRPIWDPEEHLCMHFSTASPSTCPAGGSTHHVDRGAKFSKRMHMEPAFPVYSRLGGGAYLNSSYTPYIAFTHDAHRFRL